MTGPIRLPHGRLRGTVRVPGSKSLTNRALVAAALAPGESLLAHPLASDDTVTLARALRLLGATVEEGADAWRVTGPLRPPGHEVVVDVGPAGTPARFLAALLAAVPGCSVLDGSPRMRERPMGPLLDALRGLGARIEPLGRDGFLPVRIEGGSLRGGAVSIRADVSSQFVSALQLVAPIVPGGLAISLEGPVVSGAYLELTRRVLSAFAPDGCFRATAYEVPGDDSAACFPIAGALVSGGEVDLVGLDPASPQPDAVFRRWAAEAGGALAWVETASGPALRVSAPSGRLRPVAADVDPAPDAALPLAALVAFAAGRSRLGGVSRLAGKESDRLAAALDLLGKAGAAAGTEGPRDEAVLLVDGEAGTPRPAPFHAHDDHRVAMSAAVLALALPEGSTLDDPRCVAKSYPAFWDDWGRLLASGG